MRTITARTSFRVFSGLAGLASLGLAGCHAAGPQVRVAEVAKAISAATAASDPILFQTVGGALDVDQTPTGQLSFDSAIRLGLGSSPDIQASLARVRAAETEVDQAGLLPNPVLNVVFRLPTNGGKPQVEASLAEDLLAILLRPQKTTLANARLRAAAGEAVSIALSTLADLETKYVAVQALDAQVPILEERRKLLNRVLELAQARLQGGEGTPLDVTVAQAQVTELEVEIAERLLERGQERLALAKLIGQPSSPADWQLSPWQAPPKLIAGELAWIEAGLSRRTEIQSRQQELAARETEARLARLEFLSPGEIGVDAQRDPDWAIGPSISTPIPVFDMGQARRAKAEALAIEARHELTKARRDVVESIRKAFLAASTSANTLRRVRDELVPLQQKRRDQAEAAYRAGQTDLTVVILADQDYQVARARLIDLESRTSRAYIELERAAGGPRVAAEVQTHAGPTTATAPSTTGIILPSPTTQPR